MLILSKCCFTKKEKQKEEMKVVKAKIAQDSEDILRSILTSVTLQHHTVNVIFINGNSKLCVYDCSDCTVL